jgi:ferredoxin
LSRYSAASLDAAGQCVNAAPDVFTQGNEDGRAVLLTPTPSEDGRRRRAPPSACARPAPSWQGSDRGPGDRFPRGQNGMWLPKAGKRLVGPQAVVTVVKRGRDDQLVCAGLGQEAVKPVPNRFWRADEGMLQHGRDLRGLAG